MTKLEELQKAIEEAADSGVTMLRKSQMAFDFTAPNPHDHHKAYERVNQSGTVSHIQAKGSQHAKPQTKDKEVEVTRTNVTVAEFFAAIKTACAKKGMELNFDRDEFENPTQQSDDSYYVKDGVKHARYGTAEPTRQYDGSDAAAEAETIRFKPYDFKTYIKNHDGSAFNEICEFAFDTDKKGTGYYYQLNREVVHHQPADHPALTAASANRDAAATLHPTAPDHAYWSKMAARHEKKAKASKP